MEAGAREFYDRLTLTPGSRLLDVGCGSGQLALDGGTGGARCRLRVDIAENGIERARVRARAEKLQARFEQADAEALPFEDGTFDAVVSLIGAMFAPQPENAVARESCCASVLPAGRWRWRTGPRRDSSDEKMFKIVSKFIAPSGMPSPTLWGDESVVRERLGHGLSELSLARRQYLFSYPFPPSEVVISFRSTMGRPIEPLPHSMPMANIVFVKNSTRSGRRTIRAELTARSSLRNISK
ncbi:MAG: class I SAM-dependent methyltransferase [Nitrospira sp.]